MLGGHLGSLMYGDVSVMMVTLGSFGTIRKNTGFERSIYKGRGSFVVVLCCLFLVSEFRRSFA